MTTLTIEEKNRRTRAESVKVRAPLYPLFALNRLTDDTSYFVVVSAYGGFRVARRRLGDTCLEFFNDAYMPAKQAIADACITAIVRLAYHSLEKQAFKIIVGD